MWPDDDLVDVGPLQQGLEEGIGVREAPGRNDLGICGDAVPPVLAQRALPAALHQEQRACATNVCVSWSAA